MCVCSVCVGGNLGCDVAIVVVLFFLEEQLVFVIDVVHLCVLNTHAAMVMVKPWLWN